MFASPSPDVDRPTLYCLHYLGGSAREWEHVAGLMREKVDCVAIDLPGFGDAAHTPGYAVAEMAAFVERAIRAHAARRWMLAGHSMGAKIAMVVARHAEDGAHGLTGLEGLILVAGSPPSPEPMDEQQRRTMLSWFRGDPASNRTDAQRYIADNTSADLNAADRNQAVTDVLRANRAAWVAWLEHGSREDWSAPVGALQTPALVIAGEADANLGPDAQRRLTAPHFAHLRSATLAGAKHLLPLERPHELAQSIAEHVDAIESQRRRAQTIDADYRALIGSSRVSRGTREALLARDAPDDPVYTPVAMSADAFVTLRAVLQRVIPQVGSARIDLAARIDTQLGAGPGDGWRFDALPPDAQAYRAGLLTLCEAARTHTGHDFAELDATRQDDMLTRIVGELVGPTEKAAALPDRLNAKQMRAWFEDVRADAVRLYLAHPSTLARMGYSGIANGGDGEPKSGFVRVGIGERETWEPVVLRGIES